MDLSNYTQVVTPNSSISVSNIQVSGTNTAVNTSVLNVDNNAVILNSTVTGTPTQNASLIVNRGTSPDTSIMWNESLQKWQQTRDGSTYVDIPFDTSELREDSTKLYFTNSRVNAAIAAFTGNINGNTVTANNFVGNISYNNITNLPFIRIPFNFNDSSPALVGIIPANSVVSRVEVIISTAFSNSNATLSVGTITNTTELIDTVDTKPSMVGTYATVPGTIYMSETHVVLTINSATSNTGSGMLIIYY